MRAGAGVRSASSASRLLTYRFDLSRVRGVIDGDGPDVDAVTITGCGELLQRGGVAADDGV